MKKAIFVKQAWEILPEFESRLNEIGYKSSTVSEMIIAIRKLLKHLETVKENEVCYDTVQNFINHFYSTASITRLRFVKTSCYKFLGYALSDDVFASPIADVDNHYHGDYADIIRIYELEAAEINQEYTIKKKLNAVDSFFNYLADHSISLPELSVPDILSYLNGKTCEEWQYIRKFLSWLFGRNMLPMDFSCFICPPKRVKKVPVVYSEEEIQKMIFSLDHNSHTYNRDRAILLLLAFTGIRSCDVVNLRYDNFDLKNKELSLIQKKTGVPLKLKITDQILEAVDNCFRYSRPDKCNDALFLKANAPFLPISTASVRHIVSTAYERAGIDITGRKHGSHSLRSSLASAMVNNGIDYEIVRKTLGHTSTDSLSRHIRLDMNTTKKTACWS